MADLTRAIAVTFVDELIRQGVRHAVVAPGSRSTPIALVFAEREEIQLHVRIDERSAAFLALGIAKASGVPVPVLCTSGSAAAYFHGAVLEADQGCVPLLAVTADRPAELHGIGANQTIDQHDLYGAAVRRFVQLDVDTAAEPLEEVRRRVREAVAEAAAGVRPGPVQFNVPLREPLVPADGEEPPPTAPVGAAPRRMAGASEAPPAALQQRIRAARRGVIVFGDDAHPALERLANNAGWPVIAEPHSNARRHPNALRGADYLLEHPGFAGTHRPDLVLVVGRAGLSRQLLRWLGQVPHIVVDRYGRSLDVTRSAEATYAIDRSLLPDEVDHPADDAWLAGWRAAGERAMRAVDAILDGTDRLTEPRIARDVEASVAQGGHLVVASSMPIRDLNLVGRGVNPPGRIHANRGVSGIDGFVSTVQGIALADPGHRTIGLAGDLSMLHDVNGLLPGPDPRPDVTYVVINNDGGGIFSLLPQGSAVEPAVFEQLFGTPHGIDFEQLAATYRCHFARAARAEDLQTALRPGPGVRIIEVRTDRQANADLHRRLREAAATAVGSG